MRILLDLTSSPRLDADETLRVLDLVLEAMTLVGLRQFASRAEGGLALPRLGFWTPEGSYQFDTPIRYKREPRGPGWVRENWQDPARTWELKEGDCEDLAIYLAAELRFFDGLDVWPRALGFPPRKGRDYWLFHIDVPIGPTTKLDPSRHLGMLEL